MNILVMKRKLYNFLALSFATIVGLLTLFILGWLLYTLLNRGLEGLHWSTITQITKTPGNNGGLLNAIVGSLLMSFLAILIGTPIGIMVGIYIAEYRPQSRFSTIIRFILDILLSSPSIIIGLFIYQIYVVNTHHFSGWAGAFALSIMVIPIVARTTENIYLLVPGAIRESVLALGASHWRMIHFLITRVIKQGILTGILLAFSRIIGEAAPLLFTALNNQFWNLNMNQPMANLPITIFNYAMSAFPEWQQLAWTASLIMTVVVLSLNLLVRSIIKQPTLAY